MNVTDAQGAGTQRTGLVRPHLSQALSCFGCLLHVGPNRPTQSKLKAANISRYQFHNTSSSHPGHTCGNLKQRQKMVEENKEKKSEFCANWCQSVLACVMRPAPGSLRVGDLGRNHALCLVLTFIFLCAPFRAHRVVSFLRILVLVSIVMSSPPNISEPKLCF